LQDYTSKSVEAIRGHFTLPTCHDYHAGGIQLSEVG
jgi:hypothetical protein